MPYITQEDREKLDEQIETLATQLHVNNNVGEYNYVISKLIHSFIEQNGKRYQHLNSAVGILECAKAEFIRVVVSPYEDIKISENGPVSELDNKE